MDYIFGIPRAIEPGGVVMNVRLGDYVTSHANDNAQRVQFRQQIGMLSSALEHAIPEQMFVTPENPGEAISAVKALAKAAQQGQRIYHITQANMATVLPNIHHDSLVMDEIRAALAVGKEVTTHTDAVSVPGWTGAGYIIMDAETGIGAYKIGGGENGAFLIVAGMVLIGLAIAIGMVALGGGPLGALVALGVAQVLGLLLFAGSMFVLAGLALVRGDLRACSNFLTAAWASLGFLAGVIVPGVGAVLGAIGIAVATNDLNGRVCR